MHLHVFTEEKDWPDIQLNDIIELEIVILFNIHGYMFRLILF